MVSLRSMLGLVFAVFVTSAFADTRVALVIGNARYQKVGTLENPVSDAQAVAEALKAAKFDRVDVATNLGLPAFKRTLSNFAVAAADADIALIFFSGHGIELNGENFLLPIDAVLDRDIDVPDETVALERLLQAVSGARRLKLVILDACRNNPFAGTMAHVLPGVRAVGTRGLSRIEPSTDNTLVAYAAKAGTFANDGHGLNSPFTLALLRHLLTPGLDVRLALGRVHDDVVQATRRDRAPQEPFVYGALGGKELPLSPQLAPVAAVDELAWSFISTTRDAAQLEEFLRRYPESAHKHEAEVRLEDLRRSEMANLQHNVVRPPPSPELPKPSPDERAWEQVRSSTDVKALERFLRQLPHSEFAPQARARLSQLKRQQLADLPPPAPVKPSAVLPPVKRVAPLRPPLVSTPVLRPAKPVARLTSVPRKAIKSEHCFVYNGSRFCE